MNRTLILVGLLSSAFFVALAPCTVASSALYVNGVNGKDTNDCKSPQTACKTIGQAISLASSGDSVMIAAATYAENLNINFGVKLIGSDATTTIIDGGALATVITIANTTSQVALSKLTIRNGSAKSGGGIFNAGTLTIDSTIISGNAANHGPSAPLGGGIYNSGTLTITNSTVSGNNASGPSSGDGGGIDNGGVMMISNTSITGNLAHGGYPFHSGSGFGGGIYNSGTLTITNSTLGGNGAIGTLRGGASGGGIANTGTLTISNSTLNGNGVGGKGGAYGGGISNLYSRFSAVQNSILANNSGGNCYGVMKSMGYNLSSDTTCILSGPGDLNNIDPKLGTLQNNGGPTQTMALMPGSPAIDAGNPSGCTDGQGNLLRADQRGMPRPDREDKSGCDMGAYENQSD